MTLRERYRRYRRYGLDPLPADATSEALHERHVAAEHHAHAPEETKPVAETQGTKDLFKD